MRGGLVGSEMGAFFAFWLVESAWDRGGCGGSVSRAFGGCLVYDFTVLFGGDGRIRVWWSCSGRINSRS